MKTVLITGGAGFVGSHLCDRLIKDNNIICLDNLYTGSMENISHLIGNPRFRFIKADITNDLQFDGIDEIYNLACPASPVHYQSDPIGTTLTCTVGVNNILRLATRLNAKVLQASTSEVYGNPLVYPQKEDYFGNVNSCGVRSCYDEGKRCAESIFFDYHRKYGTDIKVVRIFNTFGERMAVNDGRVISNFIVQALKGEDITIYGDGEQTRSFQYVSDLIDGLVLMMNSKETGAINIGTHHEFTINQIADIIKRETGSKSRIVHLPAMSDDPVVRRPDITKAEKLLGWSPKVSFEDGLMRTIGYFKEKTAPEKERPTNDFSE